LAPSVDKTLIKTQQNLLTIHKKKAKFAVHLFHHWKSIGYEIIYLQQINFGCTFLK
jgi:hypothetical protein